MLIEMDVNRSAEVVALPVARIGNSTAILNLVKDQVDDKTDFLFDGLFENIADTLFDEMKRQSDATVRQAHFNLMRLMKYGYEVSTSRFYELIDDLWVAFPRCLEREVMKPFDEEFEQSIWPLCERVRTHYKIGIRDTRHRFQSLLGRELTWDPLCPEYYYRCFWLALQEIDLSPQERHLVMPLFHQFVMDRYGQILHAANRTLVELKVEATAQFPTSSQ